MTDDTTSTTSATGGDGATAPGDVFADATQMMGSSSEVMIDVEAVDKY